MFFVLCVLLYVFAKTHKQTKKHKKTDKTCDDNKSLLLKNLEKRKVLGCHLNEINEKHIDLWGIIECDDCLFLMSHIQDLIKQNNDNESQFCMPGIEGTIDTGDDISVMY